MTVAFRRGKLVVLLGALLVMSCSLTSKSDTRNLRCNPASQKENRVNVHISNSDELHNLYVQYQGLIDSGQSGCLEIDIEPGTYGKASIGPITLNLAGSPPPREPKIDIVLRGKAPGTVIFEDFVTQVKARSLHLENIVFSKRQQMLLQAQVKSAFTMKNCVVAENSQGGPWGGTLLQVMGFPGQGPYTVDIERTAFARNSEGSQSALLALGPGANSFIESVRISDSLLLENDTTTDIAVMAAKNILVKNCFAYKKRVERPQQPLAPTILRYTTSQHVTFEGSVFVVDQVEDIVAEDHPPGTNPLTVPKFKGGEIFLTAAGAKLLPPSSLKVDGVVISARATQGHEAAIAAAIKNASSAPPDAGATAKLRAAFGIP